jgi:DNA helicase HerA-like ATPase
MPIVLSITARIAFSWCAQRNAAARFSFSILKRSERKQSDRKPFYLYVDEFQNFATLSFTQMLSEARKYRVFLTMAEQSTQQQDDQKLVNIILANVGTVVVFRTGSPKDEELLLPLYEPYIEKGEITNLPAYNFYIRIQSLESSEPISGETIVLH